MEESHISQVAAKIRTRVNNVFSPELNFCIFKVRNNLHVEHHDVYVPLKVSIGPLHHGKEGLQAMEELKDSYLSSFSKRNTGMMYEDFLEAIQGFEADVRRCYGEELLLKKGDLSEMMLLDGCFILELLFRFCKLDGAQISSNDPIFSDPKVLNRVRLDLMLLENQLPFFILQCLFNMSTAFNRTVSLVQLAFCFFSDVLPGTEKKKLITETDHTPPVKHLLDLLRYCYTPLTPLKPQIFSDDPRVLKFGTERLFSEASVKFKKVKSGRLLNIKFRFNGVMEIPTLKIREETECLFRNFIAFEQCCSGCKSYMSDYICFMASLVSSQYDVTLLKCFGILEAVKINNAEVCGMFDALTKEVIIHNTPSQYSKLCKRVEIHCASSWRLMLARIYRAQANPFYWWVCF